MILNSDTVAPPLANTRGTVYTEEDLTPACVEWVLGKTSELKTYPRQGATDPDMCTKWDEEVHRMHGTGGVYGQKKRKPADIKKERAALKTDLQAVLGTSFMMMDMSIALQYAPGVSRGKEALAKKTQKTVAKVSNYFSKKGVEESSQVAEIVDEDLAKAREGFVGAVVVTCKLRKEAGERPYDKKKARTPHSRRWQRTNQHIRPTDEHQPPPSRRQPL
jgi:hypothetical protein